MQITITDKTRKHLVLNKSIRSDAIFFLTELSHSRAPAAKRLSAVELSIVLVSKKEIQKINKEWRGKDYPTDVLSFPQYSKSELIKLDRKQLKIETTLLLGDVVICIDKAKEQAKEKKHSFRFELKWLLIHGILHLLGYDHELSAKEARRMQRIEKRLLTR
ncbi:MAG: rRNA maturation RNase YbeY [Oligoflexia bacterium]|nr:rRNA maturation RNase YbeY [Oligoflexia bacterium]